MAPGSSDPAEDGRRRVGRRSRRPAPRSRPIARGAIVLGMKSTYSDGARSGHRHPRLRRVRWSTRAVARASGVVPDQAARRSRPPPVRPGQRQQLVVATGQYRSDDARPAARRRHRRRRLLRGATPTPTSPPRPSARSSRRSRDGVLTVTSLTDARATMSTGSTCSSPRTRVRPGLRSSGRGLDLARRAGTNRWTGSLRARRPGRPTWSSSSRPRTRPATSATPPTRRGTSAS